MKDLEIRGAGNLLGGEQSGHIQGVGFDLYIRLVGEAVAEYRGEAEEKAAEMKIELPVNAHLPHDYVPGERLRLEAYRKLAGAITYEAIEEVLAELVDRYGELPLPATEPDRRRPLPGGRPRSRAVRRRPAGQLHQVLPGPTAGVQAHAAGPDVPRLAVQACPGRGADTEAQDGEDRRPGPAGRRDPRMGQRRHPQHLLRRRRAKWRGASRDGRTPRRVGSRGVGGHCLDRAVRAGLVSAGRHRDPDRRDGDGGDGPGVRLGPPLQHHCALAAAAVQRDRESDRERVRRAPAGHPLGARRGILRAARDDGRAAPAADRAGACCPWAPACCACS